LAILGYGNSGYIPEQEMLTLFLKW